MKMIESVINTTLYMTDELNYYAMDSHNRFKSLMESWVQLEGTLASRFTGKQKA